MIRNAQLRRKWLATIVVGGISTLLFAPSAAWADSGRRDLDHAHYRSHSAHTEHLLYARDQHAVQRGHHQLSQKWQRKPGKRLGHWKHHVDYYCRVCNHHFGARGELFDHVAYRHRVPYRNLELAISFGEFGWIFFGS